MPKPVDKNKLKEWLKKKNPFKGIARPRGTQDISLPGTVKKIRKRQKMLDEAMK